MVTTHSPFFVNGLLPEEVWVLSRDVRGYTQAKRAADMRGIKEFMDEGAKLGHLWVEGFFEIGDPILESSPSSRSSASSDSTETEEKAAE